MNGGIDDDQNFYSRPSFARPPTVSNDLTDQSKFNYDYDRPLSPPAHANFESRPPAVPPKLLPLTTANLHATTVNGYGDSPAPDDFYRNFDPFATNGHNMTNVAAVAIVNTSPSSSGVRQPQSSFRSNGNGTTPKHPIIAIAPNGLKPTVRSVSSPIEQRLASLNTAKSTSALNNGYSKPAKQHNLVKDLRKKFDENDADPSDSRRPAFRTGRRDASSDGSGYNLLRTTAESQPSATASRPGLPSRDFGVNRAKSPPVQRTQRTRFAVEDQQSNNMLSGVARPSRSQQMVAGNAQATQSMTNLSSRVPPKPAVKPVLPRKPLFGEVLAPDSGSSNVGYGIVDSRSRRTSESSLHQPAWLRNRENAGAEPISPSSYYLGDPTPPLIEDVEKSKRHNRSQSDFGSRGINPSNGPSHNRVQSQSRLPVSSKHLATHTEIKTPPSTRPASPLTAATPPGETKPRTPDQRPWSPAGRNNAPSHSRSPGRPSPGKIVTNSSLKAYISAPLPKTSPPLRSSRPRQPVSAATTASSRLKAVDKLDSRQGRNGTRFSGVRDGGSRASSRSRDPSPSNQQYKAAAARATKAISRNILEREQKDAERRRRELEGSSVTSLVTLEDVPSVPEPHPPTNAPFTSPELMVDTSFLSATPRGAQQQHRNLSNPDFPILGMPGSFPEYDTEHDEAPQSAISAATGITEFDNEPQTEAPQESNFHQRALEPTSDQPDGIEDPSETGFLPSEGRGSIKIILDTTSLVDSGDVFITPLPDIDTRPDRTPVLEERVSADAKTRDHTDLYDMPITSTPQEVVTPTYETPIDETPQIHYLDDAPFYKEPAGVDPPARVEQEKLEAWATSPYQPPSLNLPYLNTGLDVDFGKSSSRPEYLETPVTDIDYESSEAGGENAANMASKDADQLAGSLSTASSQRRRGSQQSVWTDYTVDTNYYSWQDESPYPPHIPPFVQTSRSNPLPKESMQSRPDTQFKALDYGPSSSPRMFGETPTMPSPSHPSFNSQSATNDNFGFAQLQSSPIPPVPALPSHSPPPPPLSNSDASRLQLLRASQLKDFHSPSVKDPLSLSNIQQSGRDSESRRASEDADSSHQSQWTPRTSNQISEREFTSTQQVDAARPATLFGEEKEAAEKQARRLQHRGRVIKEIIDTEAVYLKDMNVVEEIYKGTAEACPKLEPNDVNIIFRNTNEIVAFSTMFLDELKAASSSVYSPRQQKRRQSRSTTATTSTTMSPATDIPYSVSTVANEENDFDKDQKTTIGLNFGRHLQEMQRVYTDFLKSSEKASSRLSELQTDGAVNVWLSECNHVAKDLTAAWDLDALLIKPVQRITRYQLLLKELLENTPEEHPDFQSLKTTCRETGDLLKSIDDLKKRIDTVGKIVGVTRKRKESDVRTGLAKAFGRRDRAGTANSNRPPDDEVYAKLHQSWGHDFIQLQIILRDVENYTRKAQSWVHDFLRYLSAIELVVRVIGTSRPELESKWARFSMSMRDMGTVAIEDHLSAIRKQVLEPLEQVIKAYGPPELAMKKRTKRRLDFEKSLALKASNKKIDEKLAEQVEQYTALNETLKFELPQLSMLTMRLGKLCLTKLVTIQAEWYNIWQVKVRSVIEESDIPKDFADIIDKFSRDFKYQLKAANSLSIVNGAFLLDTPKSRSSQSTSGTKDDDQRDSSRAGSISNSGATTRVPPTLSTNRSRGLSINSDHSPKLPTLPTPDFRRSNGHEFSLSPMILDGPGLPTFSTKDFPPINTHSRAGSGSPAINDMSTSRPGLSRPPTGRSYESGNVSRKSIESSRAARSPSTSFSQLESCNESLRDRPPHSSRPYSGLFHSAMPPAEGADESQKSSRASSYDRERSGGYNVLYIAASLFEFNISATKTEAGYPYLTYGAGEVFDVIGEKGELWLAKNQDDPTKLVGWIWSKHFARLATD